MTPDLWQRVEAAFHDLAAIPPAEQHLRLAGLEAADPALADALRPLLASTPADAFLEPPPRTAATPPPRRIGLYEIVRAIGSGGMGTVYEARQTRPQRTVALKVLRAGLATPDAVNRFELESQVLATLRHPSIAQVFDAGVHEDPGGPVPYFVMEFIDGAEPITAFAREHRLDTAGIIDLFHSVCDAVGHAHQRGVIHRDLKPGNILVDSAGRIKVIDFGVARIIEADDRNDPQFGTPTPSHTLHGQLVGTPAYMSPEQCNAGTDAVDTRADVYALGTVLYELLAGRTPHDFSNADIAEAVRAVRDDAFPPLSRFAPGTRGDLETIVHHALEKAPSRRYQSVNEFSRDLSRFVAKEPIDARPASVVYQLTRFAQRNRSLVASSAFAAAALLVATILSVGFGVRAASERDRARRAAEFMQGALGSANPFLSATAKPDLLNSPLDPWAEWAQSTWPFSGQDGKAPDSRDVLQAAADRLATDFADDPETRAGLSEFIGWTLLRLEDNTRPGPLLKDAYETTSRLYGDSDERAIRACLRLAEYHDYFGPAPEGTRLYTLAADACDRLFGPLDARSLRAQRMLSNNMMNHRGEGANARAMLKARLDLADSDAGGPHDRADVLVHAAYYAVVQPDAAVAAALAFDTLTEAELMAGDVRLAQIRAWAGQTFINAGLHHERAESALRAASSTFEADFGRFTMSAAAVRGLLAGVLESLRKFDEAIALREELTATYSQLQGDTSWEAASARFSLASVIWRAGRDDTRVAALAERCLEEFRMATASARTGGYMASAFGLQVSALERARLFRRAVVVCAEYRRELDAVTSRSSSVLSDTGDVGVRTAELLLKAGDLDAAVREAEAIDAFLSVQRWNTGNLRPRAAAVIEKAARAAD